MTAPPFALIFTREAAEVLDDLHKGRKYADKLKKVERSLGLLELHGPGYPGLRSHKYTSIGGPQGVEVWESYVENKAASAWRIFWWYGPNADELTIVTIGPHP